VLFRLYFSLFTLTISQKLPVFILLYLLMTLISTCQTPVLNVLQTIANLELCKIDHWLRANKLPLNYNKTNFMLLTSRKHNPASFKVTINNHNISPEDNLKYLGVLLDNKLSWKPHVQKVKTNSSSGKCSLIFIGPKIWSSIPDDIKFSTTFTFKWKPKKHLLHEKNSQLWTLATFHLSRTKYCVF